MIESTQTTAPTISRATLRGIFEFYAQRRTPLAAQLCVDHLITHNVARLISRATLRWINDNPRTTLHTNGVRNSAWIYL